MTLEATVSPNDADQVLVKIPPTRPDILHECDIMEDAAIAYGFNNLPRTFPPTNTVAQPLPISKLCDPDDSSLMVHQFSSLVDQS